MWCELVYDGGKEVVVPAVLKRKPLDKQMKGSGPEQLCELAGRIENDSLGSNCGNSSGHFHRRATGTERPNSRPYCHPHFTIESELNPLIWVGVPGVVVRYCGDLLYKVTVNLKHCLDWPRNVTFSDPFGQARKMTDSWAVLLKWLLMDSLPSTCEATLFHEPLVRLPKFLIVGPETDTEAFVTLFAEDTANLALELALAGFQVSSRSPSCNDNAQENCLPPLLQAFLNECGFLALNQEDGEKLWCDASPELLDREIRGRTNTGNAVGSFLAQSQMLYPHVVIALQEWLEKRKGYTRCDAERAAQDAGHYYLGNCVSCNMLVTGSVCQWREFCKGLIGERFPGSAIYHFKQMAAEVVKGSSLGKFY